MHLRIVCPKKVQPWPWHFDGPTFDLGDCTFVRAEELLLRSLVAEGLTYTYNDVKLKAKCTVQLPLSDMCFFIARIYQYGDEIMSKYIIELQLRSGSSRIFHQTCKKVIQRLQVETSRRQLGDN